MTKYPTQLQQESEIGQRLWATFHASCDRCGTTDDEDGIDEDGAATAFYENGWRVVAIDNHDPVSDQLLCSNCAKQEDADAND